MTDAHPSRQTTAFPGPVDSDTYSTLLDFVFGGSMDSVRNVTTVFRWALVAFLLICLFSALVDYMNGPDSPSDGRILMERTLAKANTFSSL
jgi:hypothetical protein